MPYVKSHTHHGLTRRDFCIKCVGATGVALAAAGGIGWYARSSRPKDNVDVVIVGAGAAGIGAGLVLKNAGLSYVIVEADKRIGGRALTDTTSFVNSDGSVIPFDIGCAWIHKYNEKEDPFAKWAKELKFETIEHDLKVKELFYGTVNRRDLLDKLARDEDFIAEKIHEEAAAGKDIASSSVIHDWSPPMDAAATYMGPMDAAADLEHVSTFDQYYLADYEPNHLVKKGYGTLVQTVANHNQLSAVIGTPVTSIRYGGPHVLVDTAGYNPGTISAKAVIITVSTGVMNSGAIKFTPELPIAHQAAFAEVPMGLLAKIPLLVPDGRHQPSSPMPYENILDEGDGREDIYFLAWPWESDLMVGFVGGDFAWEISKKGEKGEKEAIDFATQRLGDMFGSEFSRKVRKEKGLLTPWAWNPYALGAYAAAMPGDYKYREIMGRPINDRIFFAGEALAPCGMYGTCSGAYVSGTNVAMKVADSLKKAGT